MAIANPQTWTRLRRIELRGLANQLGNEALSLMVDWPPSGEGRAVKALTERITRRLDGQQPLRDIDLAFDDLLETSVDFEEILGNLFFQARIAKRPLRGKPGFQPYLALHIEERIDDTRRFIANYRASLPPPPTEAELAAKRLGEIVPEQKIGPVRYEFVDGVFRVQHVASIPSATDAANVEAARSSLSSLASRLAADFAVSNSDRRLNSAVRHLDELLHRKVDVIQLGIEAITFQIICESSKEELDSTLFAQAQSLSIQLGMYVAQFPDWIRYADNASAAEYTQSDIGALTTAARRLVEELKAAKDVVDEEVPRSLSLFIEALNNPSRARKKVVFATVRTIENLLSVIIKSFGEVLGGLPEGMRKGVKAAAFAITASSLLLVAAQVATTIGPAAGRVLQTSWIGKAGEYLKKALNKTDD